MLRYLAFNLQAQEVFVRLQLRIIFHHKQQTAKCAIQLQPAEQILPKLQHK